MTPLPASLPPGSTPDPQRPGVYWYPQPERLVIDLSRYAKPDPRDARIAELERALMHIRNIAHTRVKMESVDPDCALEAIVLLLLASGALAGTARPTGTVYEELSA